MSKLVDKERLAQLAKALDARMKTAVAGEKERAEGIEAGLQSAINAINNTETGILKQAKDHADAAVKTEKEAREQAEELLDGRITDLEELFKGEDSVDAKIQAVQDNLDDFEEAQGVKDGEQDQAIQAAQNAADKAQEEVDALEEVVGHDAYVNENSETVPATGMKASIAANAAAIAKEAEDRAAADTQIRTDFAAADATNLQAAKDYADAQDLADRNAQKLVDDAQDERIKALEDANKEDGEVAKAIKAAQDAADKAQGEVDVVEGRMDTAEGEIDALQQFVQSHDHSVMEQGIADNLAAINILKGGEDQAGSVAAAVKAEADRAKEVEEDHEDRIAANEAFVAAQPAIDAEQDRRLGVLEADAPVKQAAIEAAQKAADDAQDAADAAQADVDAVEQRLDAEGGLVDRIEANEANIARLDGAVDVEGSVKKQIKDAIDVVNQAADGLGDRVEALETFKNTTYPAAEAKVREDFAAADAQVLADAKKYADEEITKLVDSAPDAMNTLNELAEAIKGNKDIYDGYVEQHAAAMTKMKEDLQKEIDDDVAAEAALRVAEEGKIRQELANEKAALQAEIDADVKVVADELAKQMDPTKDGLAKQIADEKSRAEGVEAGFETRIAANEAFVEAHSHEAIEQGIADNKAAIEAEVGKEGVQGNRDKAIAAALEAYSTTEEMKQVIGNVVNSLTLTMENDQVVLKLGGVDGIALTSVDLDLATDADIEAIISGLDTPAGE